MQHTNSERKNPQPLQQGTKALNNTQTQAQENRADTTNSTKTLPIRLELFYVEQSPAPQVRLVSCSHFPANLSLASRLRQTSMLSMLFSALREAVCPRKGRSPPGSTCNLT